MMKHVYNNSRSPSVRGSDISLTSSSSSSLSDDERLRGVMDHDQHHQLARHVWDRYTSSSELGKRNTPSDDDMKNGKLSSKLSSSCELGKRNASVTTTRRWASCRRRTDRRQRSPAQVTMKIIHEIKIQLFSFQESKLM